jgi:hypothetical protein
MVVCIIALVVFAFMGIFSAKYRGYAKEASRCVFRMVTLRPCDTNFDEKVKSKITGKLIMRSPKLAGFVYKRFRELSWIFMIVFIVSFVFMAAGFYNLAIYGTCDSAHPETCVFNPQQPQCNPATCDVKCPCNNETCLHSPDCNCTDKILTGGFK